MGAGFPLAMEVVPWLLAGGVLLGLAGWLVQLDPDKPVNWAFSFFLLTRGLLAISSALFHNPVDAETATAMVALGNVAGFLVPALHIAVPLAAAHFALVYRATYAEEGTARWATFATVVALAALLTTYIANPSLWQDGATFGPLFLFAGLTYLVYAAIALMMGVEYTQAEPGPVRHSFLLIALAFALVPLYVAVFEGLTIDIGMVLLGQADIPFDLLGPYFVASHALSVLSIVPVAALVVVLVRDAMGSEGGEELPGVRRFVGGLALPALAAGAGSLTFLTGAHEQALAMLNGFEGVWDVAFPLIVAYALLRHQLFGIDVKVKGAVRQSAVASMIAAIFLAGSEGVESILPIDSVWLSIAAAGVIAVVLNPIQQLAERAANALIPGVEGYDDLSYSQQIGLYREQVRIAWADGKFTEKDERMLKVARDQLGLLAVEAERVEMEVREDIQGAEEPDEEEVELAVETS